MPEGPEILFFSIYLKKHLLNGQIKLELKNDKINGEIVDIFSKGKLLCLKILSDNEFNYVHIHLGISGWIMFKDAKYVKYQFQILKNDKEYNVFIEDKTRLSDITIYDEIEHKKKINKLGEDIFTEEFTIEKFKEKIKSKNMILASFLLNQEIFSGIGNYIKNEVLYLGKLDIKIKTKELKETDIDNLYKNILFVSYSCLLEQLQNSKIEKLLDEKNKKNMPKTLEIPYEYKIYKRSTTDDGKEVIITKIGGRDTYHIKKN